MRKSPDRVLTDLLLCGAKPAIYLTALSFCGIDASMFERKMNRASHEIVPRLAKLRPYTSWANGAYPHLINYVFFKNEETKMSFDKDFSPSLQSEDLGEFHRVMGSHLGFPPKAVAYFCAMGAHVGPGHVGINFHGICLSTHESHLHEDMEWLFSHYKIPKRLSAGVFIRVGGREIPYAGEKTPPESACGKIVL